MKNESKETHVHQKRPIYNKKDQKTSNETNKQTRRRDPKTQSVTYHEKRVKRDLYTSKETYTQKKRPI